MSLPPVPAGGHPRGGASALKRFTPSRSKLLMKYDIDVKVGEGTYGVVYQARRKDSQELVAIKELKAADHQEEGVQTTSLREISLLLELEHPYVIKLHEVLSDWRSRSLWMVFEYLDFDLHKLICQAPRLLPDSPRLVKMYLWQLLKGLDYCHSRRVIHRDIKPQNLLIDLVRNEIKLADFGLARAMGVPMRAISPEVITIWYRPPEILLGAQTYTAAVDIWSLGCVFFEMMTSKPLFTGMQDIEQISGIFKMMGMPTEENWPGVSDLPGYQYISRMTQRSQHASPDGLAAVVRGCCSTDGLSLLRSMLQLDPSKRITAEAALQHAFFQDIETTPGNPP